MLQTKTRDYGAQSIEFPLQCSYDKNATIHRACIHMEASRHAFLGGGGRRRQSDTSTAGHKLALYVDDQHIDEHVVGARHVTASLP